jgi:hypothetical protein
MLSVSSSSVLSVSSSSVLSMCSRSVLSVLQQREWHAQLCAQCTPGCSARVLFILLHRHIHIKDISNSMNYGSI